MLSVIPIPKFLKSFLVRQRRNRRFACTFEKYNAILKNERFDCTWKDSYPCFDEGGQYTFSTHYGYHTAWAARVLADNKPGRHVDISSCLRFVSLVSAFIPIDFFDYRPAEISLSGMTVNHADILNLPFADDSVLSLSSMHVVEHIGLGRYGDPIDPEGDIRAMRELARVLAPGGTLLFVVPVGKKSIIQFNAHRIYTPDSVAKGFPSLRLVEFSYISDPDNRPERFLQPASAEDIGDDVYGCGCFHFVKD